MFQGIRALGRVAAWHRPKQNRGGFQDMCRYTYVCIQILFGSVIGAYAAWTTRLGGMRFQHR